MGQEEIHKIMKYKIMKSSPHGVTRDNQRSTEY